MSRWKIMLTILCAGLLALALLPAVRADEWNKATIVTFNQSVEIPGQILPAGTYMFKLFDSPSNRNIVQIWDRDGTQLYATVMAVPDYRSNATDNTVITLEERPLGSPEAIKEWFYPGDLHGVEFVYPRNQGLELASTSSAAPVSATQPVESGEPYSGGTAESAQGPGPNAQEAQTPPTNAEQAAVPETEQAAKPEASQAPENQAETQETTTEKLPKTASPLPLVGLIGLGSLGGAFLIRKVAKQRS